MLIVLDAETFFDSDYSLSKMSTSEYIRHELFKVHMVGVKVDEEDTKILTSEQFKVWAKGVDWPNATLVCHNTNFDGFILSQRYKIKPGIYLCTLSMARAALPGLERYDLSTVASAIGLAGKLEGELVKTKGVRDLSPEQYAALGAYCAQDVTTTASVYQQLLGHFPADELKLIDLTVRMFCDPVLRIDLARIEAELSKEVGSKVAALFLTGASAADIVSNNKFATLLESYGVSVPLKISPTTGQPTFALAKDDQALKALLHHSDERVRRVVEARIKLKSSIGETRARRFLEEGKEGGTLPAYLHYYGAHTGRWSGGNKINLQNLPRGGELRKSILAPEDHVLVVVDSGQIEARVTAWLAEEKSLLSGFTSMVSGGETDIYTAFASEVYGRPITKADKVERFVGKTCLAGGSLVLTSNGWKPIETVSLEDRVWDGEEWVCHKGVANNGLRETVQLYGLSLTPDHLVWSGTEWKEAQYLERDDAILSQALGFAAASLPSQDTLKAPAGALRRLWSSVLAGAQNMRLISAVLRTLNLRVVRFARERRGGLRDTGSMLAPCLMTNTERDGLIGCPPLSPVATHRPVKCISTMADAAYQYAQLGYLIGENFYGTYKRFLDGINQSLRWIERTLMGTTSPGIFVLSQEKQTHKIKEKSQTLKKKMRVYDILSAGSRNRFTVMTNAGPLIVHNCILGLGYGMGADRLRGTLLAAETPVDLPYEHTKRMVNLYRHKYRNIVAFWRYMDSVIKDMAGGRKGQYKCFEWAKNRVLKPSDMFLYYKHLRFENDGWVYEPGRNMKVNIYGGLLTENIVQGTARDIVAGQMLRIAERYRVVMMSHDEIVFVAPENEGQGALDWALQIMATSPSWALDLPLTAEGSFDVRYSK